jgi:L-threonylcarbamoyladenylate synthase
MIVRSNQNLPSVVTAGLSTVGVRMPDNPIALSLIRKLGSPIAATSANLSGDKPATSAEQVREFLKDRIDFIIDGGHTEIGVASTVVDLTTSPLSVLRQGTLKIACEESVHEYTR